MIEVAARSIKATVGYPALLWVPGERYFPSVVSLAETFTYKLVFENKGSAGDTCAVALRYKGTSYLILVDGEPTWHMGAEEVMDLRPRDPVTIDDVLTAGSQKLETWEESKTVDIEFICGFVEGNTINWVEDGGLWPVSIYVSVPTKGIFAIPWWGWALGGGAMLGVVYVAAKK